MTPKPPIHIDI